MLLGATKHLYNWLSPSVGRLVTHSLDDPHVAPYWPTWPCFLACDGIGKTNKVGQLICTSVHRHGCLSAGATFDNDNLSFLCGCVAPPCAVVNKKVAVYFALLFFKTTKSELWAKGGRTK